MADSNPANAIVKQALAAFKAGNRAQAKDLLLKAVDMDERNEQAWMLMSGVVDSLEEQQICLENALSINPTNERARKGLAVIQEKLGKPVGFTPAPPPAAPPPPPANDNPWGATPSDPWSMPTGSSAPAAPASDPWSTPFGSSTPAAPASDPWSTPMGSSTPAANSSPFSASSNDPWGAVSSDPWGAASSTPTAPASNDPFGASSNDPWGAANSTPAAPASNSNPFGDAGADPWSSVGSPTTSGSDSWMNNNTFSAPLSDPFSAPASERSAATVGFDSDPFRDEPVSSSESANDDDYDFPVAKSAPSLGGSIGISNSRYQFGDAYEFPFEEDDDPFGDDFDAQFNLDALTTGASGGSAYYGLIPADIRESVKSGGSKAGSLMMLALLLLLNGAAAAMLMMG